MVESDFVDGLKKDLKADKMDFIASEQNLDKIKKKK